MTGDLEGKTAFVTGAASGIGLAIARQLARAGVRVMMCDIEQSALKDAHADFRLAGLAVEALRADVSDKEDLSRAAGATLDHFGAIHILVNNAGIIRPGGYGAWDDAAWRWTLGVNLMGAVWGTEIFGPLIERHGEGGHVVNTASVAGLTSTTASPYNAAKHGLVGFSEGLRVELASRNIGVTTLCPGIVRTNILDSARNSPPRFGAGESHQMRDERGEPTEWALAAARRIAAGRDPLDIGALVVEAIRENYAYVFTDDEFEPAIEARYAAIAAAIDRVRGNRTDSRD